MAAYYNENDPKAAAWLRELIKAGLITDGVVDERSIAEVRPEDVAGFGRVHFFSGIGGWDYALQLAGWPDDRPVWTGSCPCQPFSTAGKGLGTKDERHLWPEFFRLIEACRPEVVFGEQVASAEVVGTKLEADFAVAVQDGDFARANKLAKRLVASKGFSFTPRWVDGVHADLEKANYSFRYKVLGAHSVGAPHIRQRLFWIANSGGVRVQGLRLCPKPSCEDGPWGAYSKVALLSSCGLTRGSGWPQPLLCKVDDGLPRIMGLLRGYGNAIVPAVAEEFIAASVGTA